MADTDLAKLSLQCFVELYREQFAVVRMVRTDVTKTETSVTNSMHVLNDEAMFKTMEEYIRNSAATPTSLASASSVDWIVRSSVSDLCQK